MWEVRWETHYDPQSDTRSEKFYYLLMHSILSMARVLRQWQLNSAQSWFIALTPGLEAWQFCCSQLDLWAYLQITCQCTNPQQCSHFTATGEGKTTGTHALRIIRGSAWARACNIPLLKDSYIARVEIIEGSCYKIKWHCRSVCVKIWWVDE